MYKYYIAIAFKVPWYDATEYNSLQIVSMRLNLILFFIPLLNWESPWLIVCTWFGIFFSLENFKLFNYPKQKDLFVKKKYIKSFEN